MPEMSADILKDFLTEPKEAGYRPVSLYQSEITRTEALSDLEELQYLMDNRYCGKDYWQRKGIDFRKCYERIKTSILEQGKVWISDFCKSIHKHCIKHWIPPEKNGICRNSFL